MGDTLNIVGLVVGFFKLLDELFSLNDKLELGLSVLFAIGLGVLVAADAQGLIPAVVMTWFDIVAGVTWSVLVAFGLIAAKRSGTAAAFFKK